MMKQAKIVYKERYTEYREGYVIVEYDNNIVSLDDITENYESNLSERALSRMEGIESVIEFQDVESENSEFQDSETEIEYDNEVEGSEPEEVVEKKSHLPPWY